MKTEYFPDVDVLSFLFTEDQTVADGRDVENDKDVTVLYDAEGRIVEIVVSNASQRMYLENISTVIAAPPQPA